MNISQHCIDACNACADACDNCATACLAEKNLDAMRGCIENDLYCGRICRLTASFLAMGGKFGREITQLCARICMECAEECGHHEHDHCKKCADACRKCADECLKLGA